MHPGATFGRGLGWHSAVGALPSESVLGISDNLPKTTPDSGSSLVHLALLTVPSNYQVTQMFALRQYLGYRGSWWPRFIRDIAVRSAGRVRCGGPMLLLDVFESMAIWSWSLGPDHRASASTAVISSVVSAQRETSCTPSPGPGMTARIWT